ncbi:MAG: hypothetical protein IT174_10815 [Acidobacteria bacterium]|nr:hypothetical protein [Acidobacteriota bacterium]
MNAALVLTELERSGAKFLYPDALTAAEWASLAGLQRGRDRAEGLQAERDRKKRRTEEARKRLNGK